MVNDLLTPNDSDHAEKTISAVVILLLTTQSQLLMTLGKNPFENIVGKGENAGNQHFLLFPQCFQRYQM